MGVSLAEIAAVALGGAFGGLARVWVSGLLVLRLGVAPHWGTLAVNVSGAGLIGAAAGLLPTAGMPWLLFVTGALGSYTTVSTFALQTLALRDDGAPAAALAHVVLSVAACLGAAALGLAAAGAVAGGGQP